MPRPPRAARRSLANARTILHRITLEVENELWAASEPDLRRAVAEQIGGLSDDLLVGSLLERRRLRDELSSLWATTPPTYTELVNALDACLDAWPRGSEIRKDQGRCVEFVIQALTANFGSTRLSASTIQAESADAAIQGLASLLCQRGD